jgi:hypothetical protein
MQTLVLSLLLLSLGPPINSCCGLASLMQARAATCAGCPPRTGPRLWGGCFYIGPYIYIGKIKRRIGRKLLGLQPWNVARGRFPLSDHETRPSDIHDFTRRDSRGSRQHANCHERLGKQHGLPLLLPLAARVIFDPFRKRQLAEPLTVRSDVSMIRLDRPPSST